MMTNENIKLEVKDLNFYYGNFHALKSINMQIPTGKVTAFIGPSGCGKSTLLRTLNRMYSLYPGQRAEVALYIGCEFIQALLAQHALQRRMRLQARADLAVNGHIVKIAGQQPG